MLEEAMTRCVLAERGARTGNLDLPSIEHKAGLHNGEGNPKGIQRDLGFIKEIYLKVATKETCRASWVACESVCQATAEPHST